MFKGVNGVWGEGVGVDIFVFFLSCRFINLLQMCKRDTSIILHIFRT